MTAADPTPALDRRALAKALTRSANATVSETLSVWREPANTQCARRIGVTGAPGTGKSTLISHLARQRLTRSQRLGVLAIDPTSPFSAGAILGDRIRMDGVVQDDERLFIRSLASRNTQDGLADNIADLLTTMDVYGFDEVVLETVGAGQSEYAVRILVDTVVLVLIPGSGDQIQAMKAGVMETADIYVVNKADLSGAHQVANDVRAVLARGKRRNPAWRPVVVETSMEQASSIEALSRVIDAHQASALDERDARPIRQARRAFQVSELIRRKVLELIDAGGEVLLDDPLPRIYTELIAQLGEQA